MTLFLVAILTLMLTASFAKVQSDRRIAEGSGANVTAATLARAALHQYFGTRTPPNACTPISPPPDGDSVRINVTGGYADVIAKVVRRPVDPLANWLFIVRSVGHVVDPVQGADPQAVRTVAQFAQWQTGRIDLLAAFTAARGLNTTTGTPDTIRIRGVDQSVCGAPDIYGLRVPSSSYTAFNTQPLIKITGTGPGARQAGASPAIVVSETNTDWYSLITGAFVPDYTSVRLNDNTYPTQLVSGNATINNGTGFGILVVTGDLTFTGASANWFGLVLVGGQVIFNATSSSIIGAVVSGLNEQEPLPDIATTKGTIGANSLLIYYDAVQVNLALASITGFAPIPNGWVDNWTMF